MDIVSLISVTANVVAIIAFVFSVAKRFSHKRHRRRRKHKPIHYDTLQTTQIQPTRSMGVTIHVTIYIL